MINVSWHDAQEYIAWLNSQVDGAPYRLPSEAEWEYAARAGSNTAYPWGVNWDASQAQGGGASQTAEVGSFPANAFGLSDMIGNVWEWTEDCWHESYENAPTDGSAWMEANGGNCSLAVLRGGAWNDSPEDLRSAARNWFNRVNRFIVVGFRVARTLPD